jgi:hypothetical protein
MLQWLLRRRPKEEEQPAFPDEQRSAARHVCDRKINEHLLATVGVSSWPALVRDISTKGIRFVVGQRHEPGMRLPLRLDNVRQNFSRPLEIDVVHITRRADGYWITGCTFAQELRPEELEKLL